MDVMLRAGEFLGFIATDRGQGADDNLPPEQDGYGYYEDVYQEEPEPQYANNYGAKKPSMKRPQKPFQEDQGNAWSERRSSAVPDNVVHMNSEERRNTTHKAVIFQARGVGDCRDIIDYLIEGKSVHLNLEQLDESNRQRILDMLSGATYSVYATLRKVSQRTYLLSPDNVEVIDNSQQPNRGGGSENTYTVGGYRR